MITKLVANADTLLSELITNPLPVVIALIAAAVAIYSRMPSVSKDVPFISPNKRKTEFMQDGAKLLREWFKKKPNRPVRVHSEVGDLLVLPANMTNEIRNDPRLEFAESTEEVSHEYRTISSRDRSCKRSNTKQVFFFRTSMPTSPVSSLSNLLTTSTLSCKWSAKTLPSTCVSVTANVKNYLHLEIADWSIPQQPKSPALSPRRRRWL
jgi:hypothetical protein